MPKWQYACRLISVFMHPDFLSLNPLFSSNSPLHQHRGSLTYVMYNNIPTITFGHVANQTCPNLSRAPKIKLCLSIQLEQMWLFTCLGSCMIGMMIDYTALKFLLSEFKAQQSFERINQHIISILVHLFF